MENKERAFLYRGAAIGFIDASKGILWIERQKHILHWPALYLNLGYALEISSKAFLLERGYHNDYLLKEVGHDLDIVIIQVERCGVHLDSGLKEIVSLLNPHFKRQALRYLEGDDQFNLPSDANQAVTVVSKYVEQLSDLSKSQN